MENCVSPICGNTFNAFFWHQSFAVHCHQSSSNANLPNDKKGLGR